MKSPKQQPLLAGVYESAQGVRDFDSFATYLDGWIKPNLIADLETVFEGARERWEQQKMPAGAPGRGDFVMAAALLAIFDHLGSFLASENELLIPTNNVARFSESLPSLSDISGIVANMARNSMIHIGWPQTSFTMDYGSWAFGLTFNASSDLRRHDNLYVHHWYLNSPHGPSVQGLKLKLNVHALRIQLQEIVDSGKMSAGVTDKAFKRVKDLSIEAGNPFGGARAKYKKLTSSMNVDPSRAAIGSVGVLREQIKLLRNESQRLGCWRPENLRTPKARDYGGHNVPGPAEIERKRSIFSMLPNSSMDIPPA